MRAAVWLLPVGLQGFLMLVDEFRFHWRRGLSRREWTGHVLDSAGLLLCLALPLLLTPTPAHLALYLALGAGSCALVTKDEFIHQRECTGGEHWCHAALFLLHPVVLMAVAGLWLCAFQAEATLRLGALLGLPVPGPGAALAMIRAQAAGVAAFMGLQVAMGLRHGRQ